MTHDLDDRLAGCACGHHATAAEHAASLEAAGQQAVETAVVRALFPRAAERRAFLRAIGGTTVAAALAPFFPLGLATEAFAAAPKTLPPEKRDLKVGFVPITCATPLIMAAPLGFYARQGLKVEVVKTPGWAVMRERALARQYDAAHMLSSMPLAITLGLGSPPTPWTVPAIENVNGQAITLALKHRHRRDPRSWKGFRLAVPFEYSMQHYLLRYYLAEAGVDPDTDVEIRVIPPPEMAANLRVGDIDGFLAPDPVNQRAVYDNVGFIHLLSKQIWDGHPCCSFSASQDFVTRAPNTYRALLRAIIDATVFADEPAHRQQIAAAIAPAAYLDQPETVVEQVLTGTFADGLGRTLQAPRRIAFAPIPYEAFAVWILTQMKRWGQLRGEVDYQGLARRVFLETEARRYLLSAGHKAPAARPIVVMGKPFDPTQPEAYIKSFPLRMIDPRELAPTAAG